MPDAVRRTPEGSRLRRALRGVWLLLSLAFRADPRRAAVVIVPISVLVSGLVAFVGRQIVDGVAAGDRTSALTWAVVGAVAAATALTLELGRFTIDMRLREQLSLEVDQRLIAVCSRIPTVAHFENNEYADRLELLRTNRDALMGGVSALAYAGAGLTQLLVTVGLLVWVHPGTLIAVLLGVPAVVISAKSQAKVEQAHEATAEDDRKALHLFDVATTEAAAKEVRIFGLDRELSDRYDVTWRSVAAIRERAWLIATLCRGIGFALFIGGFGAAILLVGRAAMDGDATPGDLFLAVTLTARLTQQLQSLASNAIWLATTLRNAARYLWIVDYADAVEASLAPPAGGTLAVPTKLVDGIRLDGVSFRYVDDGPAALDGVDLHLPAGSTVAVVGDNGAGKTTFVKLLCGLYRPSAGRITLDGIDLAAIPADAWSDAVSAGFQDYVRYELIAHEVVGVGDVDRLGDLELADCALDRAAGSDVVQTLADGWQTNLGGSLDGVDLSGGQWQKLALGRALVRDAPLLLVLDEPSSALDAETEHRLFERYAVAAQEAAAAKGAVTVLVSHRFSTVRMADLIVVLEGGRLIETGSHQQLMALGGTYAELYSLQASAYR